jgi:hypothetical protein
MAALGCLAFSGGCVDLPLRFVYKDEEEKVAEGAIAVIRSTAGMTGRDRRAFLGRLLKKHNAVIHIEGVLSLLERKLYNTLLQVAYDRLLEHGTHEIDVRSLFDLLDYDSRNILHARNSLDRLTQTKLEVNLLYDAKDRWAWQVMTLMSFAEIKDGYCRWRYDPAVARQLHNPDTYTKIDVGMANSFSTSAGLALYETCVRFTKLGKTRVIDIDRWKRLLGAHTERSYADFSEFNRKVLAPAIEEVNRVSNVLIRPEFQRSGRRVTHLSFTVELKPQDALVIESDDVIDVTASPVGVHVALPSAKTAAPAVDPGLLRALQGLGIAKSLWQPWAQEDPVRLQAIVQHLIALRQHNPKAIRNPAGYLKSLWQSADTPTLPEPAKAAPVATSASSAAQATAAAMPPPIDPEYERKQQEILRRIQTMPPQRVKEYALRFAAEVKRKIDLRKDGYPADPLDATHFRLWLRIVLSSEGPVPGEQLSLIDP